MNNYQFLFEKEREKVKDLELHLEHKSKEVLKINKSRYEWKDKSKVLHEENQELKKQVESMRNCFNCGEYNGIEITRDNKVRIICWNINAPNVGIKEFNSETPICHKFKQKEVQDGE